MSDDEGDLDEQLAARVGLTSLVGDAHVMARLGKLESAVRELTAAIQQISNAVVPKGQASSASPGVAGDRRTAQPLIVSTVVRACIDAAIEQATADGNLPPRMAAEFNLTTSNFTLLCQTITKHAPAIPIQTQGADYTSWMTVYREPAATVARALSAAQPHVYSTVVSVIYRLLYVTDLLPADVRCGLSLFRGVVTSPNSEIIRDEQFRTCYTYLPQASEFKMPPSVTALGIRRRTEEAELLLIRDLGMS